jgi:tRNA pseudouridine synthase 10
MYPTSPQVNSNSKFRIDIAFNNATEQQDIHIVVPSDVRPAKRRRKRGGGGGGGGGGSGFGGGSTTITNPRVTAEQPLYDRAQVTRCTRLHLEAPDFVPSMPPSPDSAAAIRMSVQRNSTFLRGNYVKLQRGLTQSPWFVDGKRRGSSSTQEMVCNHVVSAFDCLAGHKFHTAGREDMDVRMLGNGRPFVIELEDALRDPDLVEKDAITKMGESTSTLHDDAVTVLNLRVGSTSCMSDMLDGAASKKKTYLCLIRLDRKKTFNDFQILEQCSNMQVLQQTPIRVLHRRTQMNREKTIHWMKCKEIPNTNCFVLQVCTSAGTYVKEFVHGDRGRTVPSVADLLSCKADILQLDVLEIVEGMVH